MAITLSTAAQNAACNAVVDLLDGGTIEFQTAAGVEVSTSALSDPAFESADNGDAAANEITPDANSTGGGPMARAVFKAAGGETVYTASVTAVGGGGDIELTSTTIAAGEPVVLTSYVHAQPATMPEP